MVTFDPKKLAEELIQFVPSRFGELYPASPENEEKPSLADSLKYKVDHLRVRQHMPTGQRTVGHKRIPITPNFLSSPRGREVVSTIAYLTQQKLLTRAQSCTESTITRYMESESPEPGDVTAELIYCLKPKGPKREMTNLVSQLLAFEKLRKCVREECNLVLKEQQSTRKEWSQMQEKLLKTMGIIQKSDIDDSENVAQTTVEALQQMLEIKKKSEQEIEDGKKTTEKYAKILQSLIGMETAFFPPALQVKKLVYKVITDGTEISQLSSHINSEASLFFRFLILDKNDSATTSISAYFYPRSETSFIYIPSLGKFWYFKKRDFFEELKEVLSSRFHPGEKLEMTIWRQEALLDDEGSLKMAPTADPQEAGPIACSSQLPKTQGLPAGVGSMVTTTTTILSVDSTPPLASTSYVYPTIPLPSAPPLPPAYASSSSSREEPPTNHQAKLLVEA